MGKRSTLAAPNIVSAICAAPATKLNAANTPIFRKLEKIFCKYVFTPYTGRAKANTVMYVAMELTLSMVNAPAWYRVTSGSANTMRYSAKGIMKNRIWFVPPMMPRFTPSASPSACMSASSVNMAVVMGTARNA